MNEELFVGVLITVVGLAGVVLVVEQRDDEQATACARSFQQLVGGLGTGPSTSLEECGVSFDCRVSGYCWSDGGPLLCGSLFCGRHPALIFDLSEEAGAR